MVERNDRALTVQVPTAITSPEESKRVLTRWERMQGEDLEVQLDEIMKGQVLQAKLVDLALRATNDRDWDNIGGKPRLNARGAKKVRRIAMLRVETQGSKCVEKEFNQQTGELEYFAYECQGRVTSPWGPPMDCVGRCDSQNKFHSTRKDGRGGKMQLPASQVNRVNIAQQAQTLCVTRGVTQYLGLEGLTQQQLKQYTSAQGKGQRTANFGNSPPPPTEPPPPQRKDSDLATKAEITAAKSAAQKANIAYDVVSWWTFVEEALGPDKTIGEDNDETKAYAKWTKADADRIVAVAKERGNA